jgi:hypothetical protein
MMHAANVLAEERGKIAIKAIKNATQLDGLSVVTLNDVTQTRDEHMFGTLPKWAKSMRTWGEAAVIQEGKNGKTGNRGLKMMLLGYSHNHSDNCCCMSKKETNCHQIKRHHLAW